MDLTEALLINDYSTIQPNLLGMNASDAPVNVITGDASRRGCPVSEIEEFDGAIRAVVFPNRPGGRIGFTGRRN